MPWSATHPKYRTKQHRDYRAQLVAQLRRDGHLVCTADICVLGDRTITNPNGRDRDGLQAGHEDNGVDYRGPQHNACNNYDAAVRGHAASRGRTNTPTLRPGQRRWQL